jgi:small subunit ribosomal protein S1
VTTDIPENIDESYVPSASSIEVEEEELSFAELLDAYDYDMPYRGQILEGVILKVEQDEILVDVGLKRDAVVTRKDLSLLDDSLKARLLTGSTVMTYVLQPRNQDGELIVSINKALELEDWTNANDAKENDTTIEATVIDANRGGLLVRFGRLTGFVPQSHVVSLPRFSSDYELQEAKKRIISTTLPLKFIEIDRKRNRLIMSERLARAEAEQSRISELELGQQVKGRVVSIVKFGAFVDLGGVDGLIHISKLDHRHINHPGEILSVGDEVEVVIDGIDEEKSRISLNRVVLLPDPWESVLKEYKVNDLVQGIVTNVVDFGVFVQLPNSLQGLVHVSKMSTLGSTNPRDLLREGDDLLVRIISIEPERQRIGMSVDDVTVEEQEEWMRSRQAAAEELAEEMSILMDDEEGAIEDEIDVTVEAEVEAEAGVKEVVEAKAEVVVEAEVEEVVEAEVEAEVEEVVEAEVVVEAENEEEPVAEETAAE